MFKKILVANRGEIAVRVIRACRELGIATVAVYSTADAEALHVRLADEAVCIGPAEASRSYLNLHPILSAADITGADAIHPGYGFLSESPRFAEICTTCGFTFIGPPPASMALMGDKVRARRLAAEVGVPLLPGTKDPISDPEDALRAAEAIGFPLIIKASAGGGGRGMRLVADPGDLPPFLATAQAEAKAAFGDPAVYLERFLEAPRHVEVQILADAHGGRVHLGERECSIQRRHQKLIEEAPSPAVDAERRAALGEAALRIAAAGGYVNAGTVEFLLDEGGRFYFMEVNARIQVEHPVTETVSGLDLVKLQIRIAAGEPLPLAQSDVVLRGHSLECRVNAEDPDRFLPSPGRLTAFRPPGGPGVRVDTFGYVGATVPPHYDSLLAKVITAGADRGEAIARMLRALEEFEVVGVATTIPFHLKVLRHPDFVAGRLSTRFLDRMAAAPEP